jgi:hypothetical protein
MIVDEDLHRHAMENIVQTDALLLGRVTHDNDGVSVAGEVSPLTETLGRYRGFFALFENFSGSVDFFLLQDLVSEHCSAVRVFPAFDDFKTSSVPRDIDTYREYRRLSIEFIEARNRRIQQQPPGRGAIER